MKLAYEKPAAEIEYFEVSQSIGACQTKIGLLNSQCVLNDPDSPAGAKDLALGLSWFVAGSCVNGATDSESHDGVCYHTSANAMFNS